MRLRVALQLPAEEHDWAIPLNRQVTEMPIRKIFLDRPIRIKISAAILVFLAGISVFHFLFFPAQQKKQAVSKMKNKGESLAGILAHNLSFVLDSENLRSIEGMVEAVYQDKDLSFVRIARFQYNDTLFFRPERSTWGEQKLLPLPADPVGKVFVDEEGLYVVRPIKAKDRTLGVLMLGFDLKRLKMDMARKERLIVGINLSILILGIVLANYLSGLLTKPIRKIARAADRLTEGEWGLQVPVGYSDEIGILGRIFNRMSESLKESKERLGEYSRTLEQKVERRTAELSKLNEELASNEATITKMLKDLNGVNRELTQTKNQLENIFKSVVDRAIITINTQGTISFYSKSSELIFGYEAEEVVGRKWIQEFFVRDNDYVFILLEHTREAGIYKGETELIRRSKQVFPANVTITPLKGKEGIFTGYTIIVEDISEKKKTEENIRLLSLAVESATDGVVVLDPDKKVVFVNRSQAQMHGYEPYEMIGKSQEDFYPESYWPVVDLAMQQICMEGGWTGELEEPKKDGSTFPARISASLIKDREGRPVGMLGICNDISEKKKMEQEILERNRELLALNTIASTVSQTLNLKEILARSLKTMLELSGSTSGWIFLVDRERRNRMRLVAHQGLVRRHLEEEQRSAQPDCLCWEVLRRKQTRILDVANCPGFKSCTFREDRLHCHISIPLRSKDEVLGVMNLGWRYGRNFTDRELKFFSSVGNEIGIAADNALLFEDIQIAKEKLQKLNQKLEEANKVKGEFLANTSHELRTPLNSIIGFLGLILDGYCVDADEEKEFLRNAHQSSKQLLSIINDVLDLAKIEAGKMELELGEVDLRCLFEEVRSLTQVQAQQKKLKLVFVHENESSIKVYADPGKLRQVVINLVGNAIKFTDKGQISIKSTIQEEKGNVLIQVEDTGVGVPSKIQGKLFEKFRQADGSSTRKHGGTGLGLTISKNLVEMMGGRIRLESPGERKGTRVSFTLPVYRETENGETLHQQEGLGRIRGKPNSLLALIVEDDPVFRRFLDELLQTEGFATVLAGTADDAVSLARDLRPRIILLDFSLPQKPGGKLKDGKQVVHILSRDSVTQDILTIIITGQDLDLVRTDLSAARLEQVPRVFSKPVDTKVLLKYVKDVCNRSEKERLTCETE
ncbi:MAG: PAS domain S-box protein [candidate division Zixibacteria bacterium]|nr:PAS domain S-box protein [candidate division Zixibacteria bacterium]